MKTWFVYNQTHIVSISVEKVQIILIVILKKKNYLDYE